jgi:hypothetical protein
MKTEPFWSSFEHPRYGKHKSEIRGGRPAIDSRLEGCCSLKSIAPPTIAGLQSQGGAGAKPLELARPLLPR